MLWSIDGCQCHKKYRGYKRALNLSADQLLVLVDRRHRFIMKKPYNKSLINLVCSVITGKSQTSALMY